MNNKVFTHTCTLIQKRRKTALFAPCTEMCACVPLYIQDSESEVRGRCTLFSAVAL